ncbi:MAG: hypothetical protein AAGF20_05910 [Pseudomonadota bacterium]
MAAKTLIDGAKWLVILGVFLLFCLARYHGVIERSFTGDEGAMIRDLRGHPGFTDYLASNGWLITHRVQAWAIYAATGAGFLTFSAVSSVFALVSLALFFRFMVRRLRFDPLLALAVTSAVGMSIFMTYISNWSVFMYIQSFLLGVLALFAVRGAYQRVVVEGATLSLAVMLGWAVLFGANHPGLAILWAIGLGSLWLMHLFQKVFDADGADGTPPLQRGLSVAFSKNAYILYGSAVLAVLVTWIIFIQFFPHREIAEPRFGIRVHYYPYSEYVGSLAGYGQWLWENLVWHFTDVFAPMKAVAMKYPLFGTLALALSILTPVGLVYALFVGGEKRLYALWFLVLLVALILLASVGAYAFGRRRYAIFSWALQALFCGFALQALIDAAHALVKRFGQRAATLAGASVIAVSALGLTSYANEYRGLQKSVTEKYNSKQIELLRYFENARDEAWIVDGKTARFLLTLQIELSGPSIEIRSRRPELVSERDLTKFRKWLETHDRVNILTVTRFDGATYAPYRSVMMDYARDEAFDPISIRNFKLEVWRRDVSEADRTP